MKTVIAITVILLVGCGSFDQSDIQRTKVTKGQDGEQGEKGEAGAAGADGTDGKDALPCTVTSHDDGATIICPDGTIAEIYHGTNGEDGEDGEQGADGEKGEVGEQGEQGEKGIRGKKGVDNTLPIYVGYFCSRVVLKIGGKHYVVHGNLIPLTNKWTTISASCKLKYASKKIVVDS